MAVYTDSKPGIGDVYPSGGLESTFDRLEPLITPSLLRSRHLFGIPLVSGLKDPRTGKAQIMEDVMLVDCIDRAIAVAEVETHLLLFPTQVEEKLAWDVHLYRSHGYLKLHKRPVASIESLSIAASDNITLYTVPTVWVETANMHAGQLNIIPLTIALNTGAGANNMPTSNPAGAAFISLLGQGRWIPAWWLVRYTAGFPDGRMAKVVNELIGVIAAMDVLSILAPTFGRANSSSLSIDGMSQSVSTPGPEVFHVRMDELTAKRKLLVGKLRSLYGTLLFSGEV